MQAEKNQLQAFEKFEKISDNARKGWYNFFVIVIPLHVLQDVVGEMKMVFGCLADCYCGQTDHGI